MFTTDKKGHMKQFDFDTQELVKDYGKVHQSCILSIESTWDSKFLFTSDTKGNFHKYSIEKQLLTSLFKSKSQFAIDHMCIMHNDKFLFTISRFGMLEKWDIKTCKRINYYVIQDCVKDVKIQTMKITDDDKVLIIADFNGDIRWFNIKRGIWLKKNSSFHKKPIWAIDLSYNSRFLLTSDTGGHVKQIFAKSGQLVKDYGKIHDQGVNVLITYHRN